MFLPAFMAAIMIAAASDPLAPVTDDSIASRSAAAHPMNVPDTAGIIRLKDMVITATRTPIARLNAPASVSVVAPDDLTPSQSAQSSLSQIAGASFGAAGGQGSASSLFLRGASSENVLVLLDGVPVNSPLLGSYDLNKISGNNDRIEVLRGPASSLYGANAVGGVINITTDGPRDKRPYSRILYEKGGDGVQQLRAKFSRGLADKLSMWLGADWNSSGGQRLNSAYDGTNYSLGADLGPFAGLNARAFFQDYKADVGVPGTAANPTLYNKQRDRQQDVSFRLSRGSDSGTVFGGGTLCVARSSVANSFIYKDLSFSDVTTSNDSRQSTADGQYTFAVLPSLTLTAGGTYQLSACASDNSGRHDLRQRSVFSNVQFTVIGGLLLNAGARFDKNYSYPAQVSPAVSASYQVGLPGNWRIVPYASYGRAFRAPTTNELFWKDDLWMMYGSADLRPERSWQAEAGGKAEGGRIACTGSVFYRSTRDLIEWRSLPDLSRRTANLGRVYATGVEASLAAQPFPWLEAALNYTHCKTARDDSTHAVLPYRPQNTANGSLAINDLKLSGHLRLGWKLGARYTDCQDPGPYYTVVLPRTIICDQTLSLKISDARIYCRVDNLFNAEYQTRYGYPMPRRSYAFGILMELRD